MSSSEIHIGDPRYDRWEVVQDFETAETALAFRQQLEENGIHAVATSDWPLDRHGRGDIALRVWPEQYSEAVELLEGLTPDFDEG